ncbi:hypothetical protein BGZ61DRAFT_482488 [Ilyonectria robusta]|uniref:uncharacterized protein n=1 Tax=Ilyonectria robusta TaxID=1079257 RepID=UPI001E8DC5F6|nr:uncharacterized protein BGZ61DRAFT_482488 [Ilyonectria robusta]KAH8673249.1 hypothetical protein BGZ61DRAFT_482488 [Ilyonectria robusta]
MASTSNVTVLYPAPAEGEKFDMDYYVSTHLKIATEAWKDIGIAGIQFINFTDAVGGSALPFSVAAVVTFDSPDGARKALVVPETKAVFEDGPNYTNITPVVLLGDVKASWVRSE